MKRDLRFSSPRCHSFLDQSRKKASINKRKIIAGAFSGFVGCSSSNPGVASRCPVPAKEESMGLDLEVPLSSQFLTSLDGST